MRRIIFVVVSLIVILFIVVVFIFGIKSPEMPIQEVHKVIPVSTPTSTTPTLPDVPSINVPTNTTPTTQVNPITSSGEHSAAKGMPTSTNRSTDNSSIPIIIPSPNVPASQSVHTPISGLPLPPPGGVPGNAAQPSRR
ncbi:hypothetical protein COMNV_00978 [Commensalibacter sp. Nvir]|uniref:hypothetical protein n=1 Tax=Commensalibacter sp. Nvir TaxID=3069817 RepID=UPI002D446555|nr:hypothetical protein COMNV_00978 [Commensalibacter sp. Nvir]